MFVKICGITRTEDALTAASLGATAIGFIFWPSSRRFIEPARARAIVDELPRSVTPVGVFVNQALDDVNAAARESGIAAVQLHGDETPAYFDGLRHPVIKAVSIDEEFAPEALDSWPEQTLILLDVHDPGLRGGTGRTVDWGRAAVAARRRRVVLSGGLAPDNVAAAIAAVQPFGIDVSSGVEERPGVKNNERLRALFEAVHAHHDRAPRS